MTMEDTLNREPQPSPEIVRANTLPEFGKAIEQGAEAVGFEQLSNLEPEAFDVLLSYFNDLRFHINPIFTGLRGHRTSSIRDNRRRMEDEVSAVLNKAREIGASESEVLAMNTALTFMVNDILAILATVRNGTVETVDHFKVTKPPLKEEFIDTWHKDKFRSHYRIHRVYLGSATEFKDSKDNVVTFSDQSVTAHRIKKGDKRRPFHRRPASAREQNRISVDITVFV